MTQRTNVISWIDRLVSRIESLPGPTWLIYLLMILILSIANNAFLWLAGTLPIGTFDFYRTSFVVDLIYPLGLFHYLSITAKNALQTFSPLLEKGKSELIQWEKRLTKFPARIAWLTLIVIVLFWFSQIEEIADSINTSGYLFYLSFAYESIVGMFTFLFSIILIIQSVRQMILVSQIHRETGEISLFQLDAAHAFSNLTSRIGIGAFLLTVWSVIQSPEFDIINFVFNISGLLLAIGAFVLPLTGMRAKLQALKRKNLSTVNHLIDVSFSKLNMSAEASDQKDLSNLMTKINGLIIERNEIRKISTLPWETTTFRGFATTILLPVFIWFVTRLLDRFL